MTTINNLTIEQMREIVSGAPEGAEYIDLNHEEDQVYIALDGFQFIEFDGEEWLETRYTIHCPYRFQILNLNDLRTAIAEHDLKQCQHGYDIACLICGFGNENGVRVWRNQIESDHVTDIRNHLSPSTVVIDHDEQIKCWSCNKYMTKSQHSANDGFCIHCSNEVDLGCNHNFEDVTIYGDSHKTYQCTICEFRDEEAERHG